MTFSERLVCENERYPRSVVSGLNRGKRETWSLQVEGCSLDSLYMSFDIYIYAWNQDLVCTGSMIMIMFSAKLE